MISVIAFDYGGVIELSGPKGIKEIMETLGIKNEQWVEVYYSLNHLTNVNNTPWIDVVLLTAQKLGASPDQLVTFKELLIKNSANKWLNTELIETINGLRGKYKIALISNYSASLRQKLIDHGIIELFDEIIISEEAGFQKPEPEIFMYACEKLGIPINELLFIDDMPRSLENANIIGYTPILYVNNQKLSDDLSILLK